MMLARWAMVGVYAVLTWALTSDGATYGELWFLTVVAMFNLSFIVLLDWIAAPRRPRPVSWMNDGPARTPAPVPVSWMNGRPSYRHSSPCPAGMVTGWGGPIDADPQAPGHQWYECPHIGHVKDCRH